MHPPLMTLYQAAELLHTSERRVRELASRGSLPACRIGRAYRFDPEALRAWIAKGGQRPNHDSQ